MAILSVGVTVGGEHEAAGGELPQRMTASGERGTPAMVDLEKKSRRRMDLRGSIEVVGEENFCGEAGAATNSTGALQRFISPEGRKKPRPVIWVLWEVCRGGRSGGEELQEPGVSLYSAGEVGSRAPGDKHGGG